MTDNILASIIIPVFNAEIYLSACLDSVFVDQNVEYAFEVIIIDDGSTDHSVAIIESYAANHQLTFIKNNHRGPGNSRNIGMQIAKGKYLLFLDSDDYFKAGKLNELFVYLSSSNADVVEYGYEVLNQTSREAWCSPSKTNTLHGNGQDIFCQWIEDGFYHGMIWTRAVSRDLIVRKHIFFSESISFEDTLWSVKVFASATLVVCIGLDLYMYRIRNGSIMSSKEFTCRLGYLNALSDLYEFSFASFLKPTFSKILRQEIAEHYISLFKEKTDKANEWNMALNGHLYMLDDLKTLHRKYLYRPFIKLFGIKTFRRIKYGL